MSEALLPYYERELVFLRQFTQEFARQYPASAGRLLLEPGRSEDPHVERMIEGFALLAARVHRKLDDEFPELTDAMLNVLFPHYQAPVPSMSIAEFHLDPNRTKLPNGFPLPQNTPLLTPPVQDQSCKFRTAYPIKLWPVKVTRAELLPPPFPAEVPPPPQAAAALFLQLECSSAVGFPEMSLDRLRFYLSGGDHVTAELYGLLFNHASRVVFRALEPNTTQPPLIMTPNDCLFPVGFGRDEGVLPFPTRSFTGYRLLTEFFTFPYKFLFVDLGGFQRVCRPGFQRKLEVVIFLNRFPTTLRQAVTRETFVLGCTPIVNLFEQTAEPMPLTQTRFEYRIVPDVTRPLALEVHSVNSVIGMDPVTNQTTQYQPFYSMRHALGEQDPKAFWYANRTSSPLASDNGTEMFLSLVDLNFQPRLPAESTLVVRTLCTNRDLPGKLHFLGDDLRLRLEAAAPVEYVRCVRAPTAPLRPPRRRGAYWRLISHLNLNHLSLSDADSLESLREILRLYDYSSPETERATVIANLIDGVTGLSSRRVVGRTAGKATGFCRGIEINIELDDQKFVGTSTYLFASVLERFLGLYASLNSFTQLAARTKKGMLKKWPPRAGETYLL